MNSTKTWYRMIGVLAFAATVALSALPAAAQQKAAPTAAQIALARELIVIKGAGKIFEAVIPGVIVEAKNTILAQNPSLQKDVNEVGDQLRVEYAPRLNDVLTQFATVFAGYFTEQELKDLLAFYKSPIGQKMTSLEPEAIDKSMRSGQDWAIKFSEEVLARMRAELKKKGHEL